MYCVRLTLKPTAAMTFRILPGSILNICTYPFVPPTTLSGFLRRVAMLSVGLDLPETSINKSKPPTYLLPPQYMALGAYPNHGFSGIHRTYRKGMREFNHDAFSRIYQEKGSANFQLHTWEYFFAEQLTGYIVSERPEGLEHFVRLKDYGCKLGKEGFAYIDEVTETIELTSTSIAAHPSTILPMESLLQSDQFLGGCDIYNLYRYDQPQFSPNTSNTQGFLDELASEVEGFIPFVAAYFRQKSDNDPLLKFYTNGDDIHIPSALIDLLKGDCDA